LLNYKFNPDSHRDSKRHYKCRLAGKYFHRYQIVNIEDTGQQIEGLEFVFVELPKFKARNITENKLQALWLLFLTEIDESITDLPADLLENIEISEALENLKTSAFTKAELDAYDKYWDNVRVELALQSGYYNEGLAEGETKGELQKAYKTAIIGFALKISVDDLLKLTELPSPIFEKLKQLFEK